MISDQVPAQTLRFRVDAMTKIGVNGAYRVIHVTVACIYIQFSFDVFDDIPAYGHSPWFDKIPDEWNAVAGRLDLFFAGI